MESHHASSTSAGNRFLLGVAVVWCFKGSLPSKVTAQGVIIRRGGVTIIIVASGSGLVVKLNVKTGDVVQANQVIAPISTRSRRWGAHQDCAGRSGRRQEDRERLLKVHNDSAKLQLDAGPAVQRGETDRDPARADAASWLKKRSRWMNSCSSARLITKQATLDAAEEVALRRTQIADAGSPDQGVRRHEVCHRGSADRKRQRCAGESYRSGRALNALQKELSSTSMW